MYRLLIVDDEPVVLQGLTNLLDWQEYGLELAGTAKSGEEALQFVFSNQIDILITDIRMKNMDGLTLLKKLKESNFNQIKIIIISGYDDFDYLKQASAYGIENYLLKPVDEEELSLTLLNTIEKLNAIKKQIVFEQQQKDILLENTLLRWVTNHISFEELQDKADFLQLDFSSCSFLPCIFRPFLSNEETSDSMSQIHLQSKLQNWISSIIEKDFHFYLFNNLSFSYETVLLFYWNNSLVKSDQLITLLETNLPSLEKDIGIPVVIAVGEQVNRYLQVSDSFQKTENLLKYVIPSSKSQLITAKNIISTWSQLFSDKIFDQDEFTTLFSSNNVNCIQQKLEDIYKKLSDKNKYLAPEVYGNFVIQIIMKLFGTLEPESLEHNLFFNQFNLFELLQKNQFTEAFNLIKNLQNTPKTPHSVSLDAAPVITSVLQYIDNNYNTEMSLKLFSYKFHIDSTYLGQKFKAAVGISFNQYINEVRIRKAQELLISTDLRSGDIAKKVGYNNVNYFSNQFKKYTGKYPTEYRQLFCDYK